LYRGLVNYPVAILSIISILTITYLSISILNRLESYIDIINNMGGDTGFKPIYVLKDNNVYVQLDRIGDVELYEFIKYSNGTQTAILLPRNGNLYGPMVISRDIDSIILAVFKDRVEIIDILVREDVENITLTSKRIYPPSILLNIDNNGMVYLKSLNGNFKYYMLKPIQYYWLQDLPVNKTVRFINNSFIIEDVQPQPVLLRSFNASESSSIDLELYSLINYYGNVIEYRRYVLNKYLLYTSSLNPFILSLFEYLAGNQATFNRRIYIGKLNTSRDLIVESKIVFNVNRAEVIDRNGGVYIANISVSVKLLLSNVNTSVVDLGSKNFTSINTPIILEFNGENTVANGFYDVYLDVNITVQLLQVAPRTRYFVFSTTIYGGFNNYEYIHGYGFDYLKIILDNTYYTYIPTSNQTIIELVVEGFTVNNTVYYIYNNTVKSRVFNTYYSGSNYIHVVDYVKPALIVITPRHVKLDIVDTTVKLYILSSDYNTVLYGIYTYLDSVRVKATLYPYIKSSSQYIVFEDKDLDLEVYILDLNSVVAVYYNNTLYNLENVVIDGFILVDHLEYKYPIMLVNNTYCLNVDLEIKYIDGFREYYSIIDQVSIYTLRNMFISEFKIILRNNPEYTVFTSLMNNVSIIVSCSNEKYMVEKVFKIELMGHKLNILVFDSGRLTVIMGAGEE